MRLSTTICLVSLFPGLLAGPSHGQDPAPSKDLNDIHGDIAELRKEIEELKSRASEEHEGHKHADTDIRFFWKNGLNFETHDKKTFKGKAGGRLQFDLNFFSQDEATESLLGDADSGAEFRRVRLYTSGEIDTGIPTAFYKLQLDFAGGDVRFADVYLGFKKIPYMGTFQAGQMYEPFSLEQLTSDNYITFLERSLPIEAFSPGRNIGAMARNSFFGELMTATAGAFVNDANDKADGEAFDSNIRFPVRITGLPWYDESSDGRRYLHVGLGGNAINAQDGVVRYRSRPEAHLAQRYVDTGDITADWAYLVGTEVALTVGPLSVQGEYMRTFVDASGTDPSFHAYYLFASYFLTGEHRPYKKSSGVIDRVKPLRNFSISEGGPGAVELTARFSYLDLDDEMVSGGELTDWTVGVNWYQNPNTRVMFNYVLADLDRSGIDGKTDIFLVRFQVDF